MHCIIHTFWHIIQHVPDDKFATDIDECAEYNGDCEHNCTNINGSYYCTCDEGYILDKDGLNCTKITKWCHHPLCKVLESSLGVFAIALCIAGKQLGAHCDLHIHIYFPSTGFGLGMFSYYKLGKYYCFSKNIKYEKLNDPKTKHIVKPANSWDYKKLKLEEDSEDDNLVINDDDDDDGAKDEDDCKKNSD